MPVRGRYSPFNITAFNQKLDHGSLSGLGDDDHTQYIKDSELFLGTAQGQILFWDTAQGAWVSTETNELFWDDVNKRFGIKNANPTSEVDVTGTVTITRLLAGGITE